MQKTEHRYLTLLIIRQYCIHFTELHTHFGAAIFTGQLGNFIL